MKAKNEEIKSLFGQLNSLKTEEYCFRSFDRIVTEILSKLEVLIEEETIETVKNEYIYVHSCLTHTSNEEVEFIKYHENRMHKRNAAKVRAIEYRNAVAKAVDQVCLDLILIINKK